jgi:exonuclease SbcC
MKPIKLSIEGLNSFKEAQVIEFDKLTQYGLFGVFGPTGSGKSSLLDGITLALYGKTSRDSSNFINVECDKMQVSFEFMVNQEHYRVVRTYKRNNQGKVNASKPTRIELIEEGITTLLEEQTTHVDKACFNIIGLEFKDFIRTVVLPQGKFSEFIQLKGKDRREMLERLFALSKYGDDLSRKLSSVIRAEKDKALALSGELKGYESVSKSALKELKELDVEVSKSFDEKKLVFDINNEAYETSKKLLELSLSLDIEIDKMAHLKLEEPAIITRKETLKEARKIVQVLPYYTQSKSLEGDIKEKSTQHLELQEKYSEAKKVLDSHQRQFTEIETTHNEFMSKYDVKHLRLVEGIKQLELLKTTDDEKDKLEKNIILQTAEIKTLELHKVSIEDDITKIKKVLSDFETILQANELSLEIQKFVDEGVTLELSLTQVEKEILEVSKSHDKDDIEKKKNSVIEKTIEPSPLKDILSYLMII